MMAKHHFAICALGPLWRFLPPQATCERFSPALEHVVAQRAKWLAK